jgi:hypothetical protein
MDDLWAACLVNGTCAKQTTSTTTTSCFGNGVKVQTTSGTTGTTVTAKKGDTVCYTKTFASGSTSGGTYPWSSTITVQNGSGATVATMSVDSSGIPSVTCPGGTPTQVDDSCLTDFSSFYYYQGTTPPTCTEGTCMF